MAQHNDSGNQAEVAVADYLANDGFKILGQNWKTRFCEIDIVAKKSNCIYFVEVKYRKNNDQGSGFDYVTSSKLRQMGFAAQLWVETHRWSGDFVLSAAEVSGSNYDVEFIQEAY